MDLQSYIELKKKYSSMNAPQPVSEEVEVVEEETVEEGVADDPRWGFVGQLERQRRKMFGTAGERNQAVSYEKSVNDIRDRNRAAGAANVGAGNQNRKADGTQITQNDIEAETRGRRLADPNYKPGQGVGSGNKASTGGSLSGSSSAPAGAVGGPKFSSPADEKRQAARAAGQDPDRPAGGGGGSRPAGGGGGGSRPAGGGSRPASSTRPAPAPTPRPTPQKQTGDKAKDMATWAKANPKLAAAQKQRQSTRGTSATTNPLMKDMKSRMPAPKPTATATPKPTTTPKATPFRPSGSGSGPKFNPNAPKIKLNNSVEVDSFDIILEYLVGSGFPEQEALVIMAEMSEEKREQILSEMDYQAPPKPPAEIRQDSRKKSDNPGVTIPSLIGITAAKAGEAALEAAAKKKDKKKKGEPKVKPAFKEEIDSLRDAYNSVFAPKEEISEEEADKLRDQRQERGGVDGNKRYPGFASAREMTKHGVPGAKTAAQREAEEKYGKGATAMDIVKAQMEKKYGKGAIMDPKDKKKKD